MTITKKSAWANIDWFLVFLYLSLALIGWLMLYAAEFDAQAQNSIFSLDNPLARQTIWILASIGLFWLLFVIDDKFWNTFAYVIFVITIIILVLVLIVGTTKKGSTSWITLLGFSFQPAEFAKLGTCLALANYLSYYKTELKTLKSQMVAAGIFALPAALILLQPDAGSAFVFLSLGIMMFRAGLSPFWVLLLLTMLILFILSMVIPVALVWSIIIVIATVIVLAMMIKKKRSTLVLSAIGLTAALLLLMKFPVQLAISMGAIFLVMVVASITTQRRKGPLVTLFFLLMAMAFSFSTNYVFENLLEPHQKDRINVWLRPELSDPRGSMYNVLQSKMAIGSGGLQGKGYLNGTLTKLNYVPEQTTDFIFCIIGEEQGFLGAMGIIVIFLLLLYRITLIAERMRSEFNTYFAYGVAGFIFFHFLVNIGMTMGILPVIGIPLPFISKGGSSFLIFSIMISILVKMDSKRRVAR